jgi:hypothetical protein
VSITAEQRATLLQAIECAEADGAVGVGKAARAVLGEIPDAGARGSFFVVDAIIRDLSGRSGLDHCWEGIDDDVQQEIRITWARIVERHT